RRDHRERATRTDHRRQPGARIPPGRGSVKPGVISATRRVGKVAGYRLEGTGYRAASVRPLYPVPNSLSILGARRSGLDHLGRLVEDVLLEVADLLAAGVELHAQQVANRDHRQ